MIRRMKIKSSLLVSIAFIFAITSSTSVLLQNQTNAITASDWNPGNIISDQVFTNQDSMNYDDIRNFLKSKVPNCDTNGTQTSEYGRGTRAQWGAAKYGQSTFTCLKDYVEGGRSAAQ